MTSKIIKPEDMKEVKHPFGTILELSNQTHSPDLNIALVKIADDRKHYHKKSTEIYYILKGKGTIELNDQTLAIDKGYAIIIEPLTKHKIKSSEGSIEFIVTSSPPYSSGDEFYN